MIGPAPGGLAAPEDRLLGVLLLEAHEVAAKSVERLRHLRRRFPDDLPGPVMAQLERPPAQDQRRAVRLAGGEVVEVRDGASRRLTARVIDRGLFGLGLRLRRSIRCGAVLSVRLDGGWHPVQVRHCRRDGRDWCVGCEALDADGRQAGRPGHPVT
jgi:hypothetical protein